MAKVYVTQHPHRRDKDTGALVPLFNITPVAEHGEARVMMPPGSAFINTAELVRQLSTALHPYSYEDGDSVLLLGDSVIQACTCAILAKRNGKFAVLRWDRNMGRYTRITVTV